MLVWNETIDKSVIGAASGTTFRCVKVEVVEVLQLKFCETPDFNSIRFQSPRTPS